MVEILVIVLIIWTILKKQKEKGGAGSSYSWESLSEKLKNKAASAQKTMPRSTAVKSRPSATPNKPQFSVVPNKPKKQQRTKAEQEMQLRTRASSAACSYQAAYSKGRPERLGVRADYEPGTPSGRERVRCPYCGAENFVPAGSRDHYHCYFCWEKL